MKAGSGGGPGVYRWEAPCSFGVREGQVFKGYL